MRLSQGPIIALSVEPLRLSLDQGVPLELEQCSGCVVCCTLFFGRGVCGGATDLQIAGRKFRKRAVAACLAYTSRAPGETSILAKQHKFGGECNEFDQRAS
jgi:hypothetical protein